MDQMILRAIQQEVRRIECKLDNPRTGLAEIKAEVAGIENAIKNLGLQHIMNKLNALAHELDEVEGVVDDIEDKLDNPHFGLEEIKEEIEGIEHTLAGLNLAPVLAALNQIKHEVDEVENKLDNPDFGLEEIKEEVAAIEGAVTSPETGLPEIKAEVAGIEEMLEDPQTGLAEIKREIAAIEAKLDNLNIQQLLALLAAIKATVLMIEQKLDNPHFGLQEIKNEVAAIEGKLDSPHFGLQEIKTEVADIVTTLHNLNLQQLLALLGAIEAEIMAIEAKLDSPHFGLQAIKTEIHESLEGQEGQSTALTSGPVFRTNDANSVLVTIRNNAGVTQGVTIQGLEIEPIVAPLTGSPTTVTLNPGQATTVKFGFPHGTLAYEIRVLFTIPGSVGVFSAARTQDENAGLAASTLLPENTVRNEEFKPLFVPAP